MKSEDELFEEALFEFGRDFESGKCEQLYAGRERTKARTRGIVIVSAYRDPSPPQDPAVWDLDAEDPLSLVNPEPIPDPGED